MAAAFICTMVRSTSCSRHSEIALKCARHILEKQNADGGWSQYPGGKFDVSISVKAYFTLKLTGHDVEYVSGGNDEAAVMPAAGR